MICTHSILLGKKMGAMKSLGWFLEPSQTTQDTKSPAPHKKCSFPATTSAHFQTFISKVGLCWPRLQNGTHFSLNKTWQTCCMVNAQCTPDRGGFGVCRQVRWDNRRDEKGTTESSLLCRVCCPRVAFRRTQRSRASAKCTPERCSDWSGRKLHCLMFETNA